MIVPAFMSSFSILRALLCCHGFGLALDAEAFFVEEAVPVFCCEGLDFGLCVCLSFGGFGLAFVLMHFFPKEAQQEHGRLALKQMHLLVMHFDCVVHVQHGPAASAAAPAVA